MRVKYLAQEHNAVPQPGLEPGLFNPESSALTIRPPHSHTCSPLITFFLILMTAFIYNTLQYITMLTITDGSQEKKERKKNNINIHTQDLIYIQCIQ